jgi:hypothetical protein
MQSGCLGKSIAVQCTAMGFTPLRLLCSRHRLQGSYAPASAIAVLGWAEAQVFTFAVVGRLVGSYRLYPARAAAVTAGTEAAAADALAKGARPLLNCANVRGATANLKLTFHLDHLAGADHHHRVSQGRAPLNQSKVRKILDTYVANA